MLDATFACPDLTTFCRLDELGLVATGQRGTISATGCSWAWRPAKGHENRRFGRMAALGAARSGLAMEPSRPSNCLTRSVRD